MSFVLASMNSNSNSGKDALIDLIGGTAGSPDLHDLID